MAEAPVIPVCRTAGLDPSGARLLHARANHTYHLPAEGAVVRLRHTRGSAEWERRLTSAVNITAWLAGQGFPTVEPLAVPPVTVKGWTATFWRYLPQPPTGGADTDVLGGMLKTLHALPTPPVPLEPTNPLGSLLADLDQADEVLTSGQHDWLRTRAAQLTEQYQDAHMPLGHGIVHGDAHEGNLLLAGDHFVLGDWDSVSHGPHAQDLMPTLDGVLHFGQPPADWQALCRAYGTDPDIQHHPGMQLLCRARELRSLAAYIRSAPGRPDIQAELNKRLTTLIDGVPAVWRAV